MLNTEMLEKLIYVHREDKEMLNLIWDEISSFEEYHKAIFEMECKLKLFSTSVLDREDYQELVASYDKKRTMNHNRVLTAVNVLNRLAEKSNLAPIYDGIVSEERPYRREVANAVLVYVENIIKDRR